MNSYEVYPTPKILSADYFHLPRGSEESFPTTEQESRLVTYKSPDFEHLSRNTMADDHRGKHEDVLHVERVQDDVDASKDAATHKSAEKFQGDVGLAGPGGVIYLIPTPSTDPRGMHAHR